MSPISSKKNTPYILGFIITLAICFQSVSESPAGIVFLAFLITLLSAHFYLGKQGYESFEKTKKHIGSELFLPYTIHLNKKFENWITLLYLTNDYFLWRKIKSSHQKFNKDSQTFNFSDSKINKTIKKNHSDKHISNLFLSNYNLASKLFNPQAHTRTENCQIHWNSKTIPTSKFSLWQIL